MNMEVIVDFLKTGYLKKLHPGMLAKEVIEYLGVPDGYIASEFDFTTLYQTTLALDIKASTLDYGCLELVFERIGDTLIFIQIYVDGQKQRDKAKYLQLAHPLGGEWIYLLSKMNRDELISFLETNSISIERRTLFPEEAEILQIRNEFQLGVTIVVNLENDLIQSLSITLPM